MICVPSPPPYVHGAVKHTARCDEHTERTKCILKTQNERNRLEACHVARKCPEGAAAAGSRLGRPASPRRAVPAGNQDREREISDCGNPRRGLRAPGQRAKDL